MRRKDFLSILGLSVASTVLGGGLIVNASVKDNNKNNDNVYTKEQIDNIVNDLRISIGTKANVTTVTNLTSQVTNIQNLASECIYDYIRPKTMTGNDTNYKLIYERILSKGTWIVVGSLYCMCNGDVRSRILSCNIEEGSGREVLYSEMGGVIDNSVSMPIASAFHIVEDRKFYVMFSTFSAAPLNIGFWNYFGNGKTDYSPINFIKLAQ